MRRAATTTSLLAALVLAAPPAFAAPTADLHEIKWFVHTDLIDVGMGMDLPFYEAILDAGIEEVPVALEGDQGPTDTVCCSRLVKEEHSPSVTLTTFGTPGDGLDVLDAGDFATISGIGGSGSRGFIIDSINSCGGSPAVGCATLPACDSTPDDDPDLVLIVTMDAEDSGFLGLVIAHERGHNGCLVHVAANTCELMRGAVSGGCLSAQECADYTDARTTTGGSCVCHADGGGPETDGTTCDDAPVVGGQCSGGLCGGIPGDASVQLVASGGPESASGATTDDPLLTSTIPGGWSDLGAFGSTIRGLAHDKDSGTLYGVRDVASADDELVTVDPTTGSITGTVGTITGHAEVISLAFDPGPTTGTGDDRLLALSTDGSFEDLIEIDPSTATPTTLGPLSVGVSGNFQGLAYDSANQAIYASGFAGGSIWEIDESACGNPFFCTTTEVMSLSLPRIDSGLTYSPDSGRLYLVGRQANGRILYDAVDASTLTVAGQTMGIDPYTIGALAAIPVPEPSGLLGVPAGVALLWLLARRRRPE
jgi:hypothetical protein